MAIENQIYVDPSGGISDIRIIGRSSKGVQVERIEFDPTEVCLPARNN